MAIRKETDLNTGVVGNYWNLTEFKLSPVAGGWQIEASYKLWLDEQSYLDSKEALQKIRRVVATVNGSNPTLNDIEAALDAEITREPVQEVIAVAGGIVGGREVEPVEAVEGVRAGQLQGGEIV